jgi:hypothetical protein
MGGGRTWENVRTRKTRTNCGARHILADMRAHLVAKKPGPLFGI